MQTVIRFLIGGTVVSLFAMLGDVVRPKSFAGIFGAAPSVALATLALTATIQGSNYAATEARSMMVGAVALLIYAWICARIMWSGRVKVRWVTVGGLGLWMVVALVGWWAILRGGSSL